MTPPPTLPYTVNTVSIEFFIALREDIQRIREELSEFTFTKSGKTKNEQKKKGGSFTNIPHRRDIFLTMIADEEAAEASGTAYKSTDTSVELGPDAQLDPASVSTVPLEEGPPLGK